MGNTLLRPVERLHLWVHYGVSGDGDSALGEDMHTCYTCYTCERLTTKYLLSMIL